MLRKEELFEEIISLKRKSARNDVDIIHVFAPPSQIEIQVYCPN